MLYLDTSSLLKLLLPEPERFGMMEERIARDRMQREPRWTQCVAVGSEGFVRSIQPRIRGRQELEVVGEGDGWVLRERGTEYAAHYRAL